MAHIEQTADSIQFFENDRIYQMLTQIGSKQIDKSVDLSNVNEYIGSCLMNQMWINDNPTNNRFYQDLLQECVVTPGHKFVECVTAPFTLFRQMNLGPLCSWEELIKSAMEQFVFDKLEDDEQTQVVESVMKSLQQQPNSRKGHQSLSVQAVFRSENVQKSLVDSDSHMRLLERKIEQIFSPVSWNPDAVQLHFIEERSCARGHD